MVCYGVLQSVGERWCEKDGVWQNCVCVTRMCVKDGVWQSVGERWCGRRGAEEEEAEEDNTGDADLKTRTPHNFVGKTVHVCILPLGSRAWCARIPDNSSLVHLENGVRERSKEKRRSVVEDLGRWAGKTKQQREKGAQNGAQPSWQRALCRGPFWRICAAERPSTTLHYSTLHSTILQLQLHNYTPLHSTTLHYTKLHYTTLHYTPLHYTTLHHTKLHYTSLHYTTLHYTTLHITLHYATFHYTSLHYTTLHSTTLQLQLQLHNYTTTLHSTTLNYTTLHYTTLHCTTLHYTQWHCTTDRQVDS